MPRVSDLRDELDKKVGDVRKIQEDAEKRADKKLTQDEMKRFKDLDKEIRDLEEQIDVAERAEKVLTRQADAGAAGGDDAETRNRRPAPGNVTHVRDLEAEKPFATFGQQLRAIMAAAAPGGNVDKRLLHINEMAVRATGQSENVLSEGGFLVGTTFAKEILQNAYQNGKLISRVNWLNLDPGTNKMTINVVDESSRVTGSRMGGLQLYWKGEAAQLQASKIKFRELNLELRKLTGLWYVTDEMQKDASVLESVAMQGFGDEFKWMLDDAAFGGDGSNKPKGFTRSGALVVVSKESGQANGTINVANLFKMEAQLLDSSDDSAIWVAHKSTKPQLAQLAIGNIPVFLPGDSAPMQGKVSFGTLLGRPIVFLEQCEYLGTQNDIMLVDPRAIVGIKQGELEIASSIHVQFIYGEQVFRFTYRCDMQPVLNKDITPTKGTAHESAYLTLQAR